MDRGTGAASSPAHSSGPGPRRQRPLNVGQYSRPSTLSNGSATRGRRRPGNPRPVRSGTSSLASSSVVSTPSTIPSPQGSRPNNQAFIRSRPPRPKNRPRRRIPPPPTAVIKLIVRRLPPTLPANKFFEIADANGAAPAVWRSYVLGSVECTGSVKRTIHVVRHSVAYFSFSSMDDAINFHNKFQGYVFADNLQTTTNQSQAQVVKSVTHSTSQYVASIERAINQTTPLLRRRNQHALHNTIEKDADYQNFLKTLESGCDPTPPAHPVGGTAPAAQSTIIKNGLHLNDDKRAKGKTQIVTPLMEDVRARRKERDLKKKATKMVIRTVRTKGRPILVTDVGKSEPNISSKAAAARRKKRRGSESSKGEQQHTPVVTSRPTPTKTGAASISSERDGKTFRRRDEIMKVSNVTSSVKFSGRSTTNIAGSPEGSESSSVADKRPSRHTPSGRGGRGRGKYRVATNGIVGQSNGYDHHVPATEHAHAPVRLLKKEASNVNKT